MPRQNRITPFGTIEAVPARGTLMGNRGILHDEAGRLGRARWRTRAWIACRLAFKGRHRPIMAPHRYTELFFLDEATAFAAGHRPCAECRRADFERFRRAWSEPQGLAQLPRAPEIDRVLHVARLDGRAQRRHVDDLAGLPDGVFVTLPERPDEAWLVHGDRLLRWSHAGYDRAIARPDAGTMQVLTPAPMVAAFRAGYAPAIHASADALEPEPPR